MTARGVEFLQLWVERNVLSRSTDRDQALRLAMKLDSDTAAEGLTFGELETERGTAEAFIRDIIVHVGEPGTPGD